MKRLVILLGFIAGCDAKPSKSGGDAPPVEGAKAQPAPDVKTPDVKAPDAPAKITVKLAGLEVYNAEVEKLFVSDDPFAPKKRHGTMLYLWVSLPDQHILNVDQDGSELASIVDDRGTELYKPMGEKSAQKWLCAGKELRFSPEGNSVMVQIHVPTLPTAGAKELTVKGQLGIRVAGDLEVGSWEGATKDGGVQGKIGPIKLFGGKGNMSFSAPDPNLIKQVSCFEKDGKPLKGTYRASGSGSVGGVVSYDSNFTYSHPVDFVKVEVKYAKNVKSIVVPVQLSCSLGF
ncbi:MAG: hypothetical protein K8U57_20105 [Planctomycetes bacterium]|nr:hypothetical protein [Planctomycetota bacterium]